jgi:hypothetical protein
MPTPTGATGSSPGAAGGAVSVHRIESAPLFTSTRSNALLLFVRRNLPRPYCPHSRGDTSADPHSRSHTAMAYEGRMQGRIERVPKTFFFVNPFPPLFPPPCLKRAAWPRSRGVSRAADGEAAPRLHRSLQLGGAHDPTYPTPLTVCFFVRSSPSLSLLSRFKLSRSLPPTTTRSVLFQKKCLLSIFFFSHLPSPACSARMPGPPAHLPPDSSRGA